MDKSDSSRNNNKQNKDKQNQGKENLNANNEQVSNKQIKESSQGTKLHNVNPTKALQEQAKKEND